MSNQDFHTQAQSLIVWIKTFKQLNLDFLMDDDLTKLKDGIILIQLLNQV